MPRRKKIKKIKEETKHYNSKARDFIQKFNSMDFWSRRDIRYDYVFYKIKTQKCAIIYVNKNGKIGLLHIPASTKQKQKKKYKDLISKAGFGIYGGFDIIKNCKQDMSLIFDILENSGDEIKDVLIFNLDILNE